MQKTNIFKNIKIFIAIYTLLFINIATTSDVVANSEISCQREYSQICKKSECTAYPTPGARLDIGSDSVHICREGKCSFFGKIFRIEDEYGYRIFYYRPGAYVRVNLKTGEFFDIDTEHLDTKRSFGTCTGDLFDN